MARIRTIGPNSGHSSNYGKLGGVAATGGTAGSEPLMFNSQFVDWVGVSKVTKPYWFDMVFSDLPCRINCRSSGKNVTEADA